MSIPLLLFYFFLPNARIRWTTAPVSSSDSLPLKAGMNLPFPFFIESAIFSSVFVFCHSGLVKSGCPRDRQLGKPTPSLPWHSAHLLSNMAPPSALELPEALDDVLWPLAVTISFSGANNENANAAESVANAKLFFLIIFLLLLNNCSEDCVNSRALVFGRTIQF